MQCCEDGLKELKIFGFCRNLMRAGSWRGRKEYLREKENWKEKKKEEQEEELSTSEKAALAEKAKMEEKEKEEDSANATSEAAQHAKKRGRKPKP